MGSGFEIANLEGNNKKDTQNMSDLGTCIHVHVHALVHTCTCTCTGAYIYTVIIIVIIVLIIFDCLHTHVIHVSESKLPCIKQPGLATEISV